MSETGGGSDQSMTSHLQIRDLRERLDAALRRIEALEAHTARLENERASIFQAFGGVEPLIKRVETLEAQVARLRVERTPIYRVEEDGTIRQVALGDSALLASPGANVRMEGLKP